MPVIFALEPACFGLIDDGIMVQMFVSPDWNRPHSVNCDQPTRDQNRTSSHCFYFFQQRSPGEKAEVDPDQFQDPENEYDLFASTTYEQDARKRTKSTNREMRTWMRDVRHAGVCFPVSFEVSFFTI